LVTLTTDMGGAYAAQMKAVLYRSVPPGHVVDLVHDLPAHRIEEAAFLLEHLTAGFPAGSIHVAVVDPGVGGHRAPVGVRCREGSYLVGPDNGLLVPTARHFGVREVVRLEPEWVTAGGRVSATFEGRDLFAPAAARLASGVALRRLGPPWRLLEYEVPSPVLGPTTARGQVLHVDAFGNAITNVPTSWAPEGERLTLTLEGRTRSVPRRRTYTELAVGEVGLVGSSFGLLEVCAREARAAEQLGLTVGHRLDLRRGKGRGARR
jgi:S-adenosylmethionine hydrolase